MDHDYLKQKRILLVDDEQELLDMVVSILNEDGFHNIKSAKTVGEAITVSETYQPEFAILDVMLPDGNGFDLMERLKKVADYPMLFLTARGEDNDKFRGFGLGADDYMVKPFLPKELLFRVSAILRRSYKTENPLVKLHDSEIDFERAEIIRTESIFHLQQRNMIFSQPYIETPDESLRSTLCVKPLGAIILSVMKIH